MPSSERTERTRRGVLAAAGTAAATLLSGCAGVVSPSDSSAPSLHLWVESLGDSLRERHVIDLADTRPGWDEQAFRAALNGTDYETAYRPPFPGVSEDDPAYVRHDGTYYHLDALVTGERRARYPVLRLYEVGRIDGSGDLPEYVVHEDLPEADRTAVRVAYMAARARDDEGGVPWTLVQRGGYAYRDPDRRERSRLLAASGPSHVAFRDVVYRVEVTTGTFHEPRYRPDVDPVAESPEGIEEVLQARLVDVRLDPGTLSRDAREIVRAARDDEYEETYPFSDAYESLLRALDERAYLDGDVRNDAGVEQFRTRLVRYGPEYLRYRFEFVADGRDGR